MSLSKENYKILEDALHAGIVVLALGADTVLWLGKSTTEYDHPLAFILAMFLLNALLLYSSPKFVRSLLQLDTEQQ